MRTHIGASVNLDASLVYILCEATSVRPLVRSPLEMPPALFTQRDDGRVRDAGSKAPEIAVFRPSMATDVVLDSSVTLCGREDA